MLGLSRLSYSLATNGQIPAGVGKLHREHATPYLAIAIASVLAFVLVLTNDIDYLAGIFAFGAMLAFALGHISIVVLRYREPNLPRPYRAWGYPWTTLIVLAGSIAFLIGAVISDKKNSLWALAILAASYPLYVIVRLISPAKIS
jgi:APA family basic amino acid/polyamine antiporter